MLTEPLTDRLMSLGEPMLADSGRPEALEGLSGTHVFDEKLDGIRALVAWDGAEVRIRNRNGADITSRYPEIELAALDARGPMILDGEVMALDGKFESIAWRDKQKGGGAHKVPAKFVAFDVLHHPMQGDVRHLTYAERRLLLNDLHAANPGAFQITTASASPSFFDHIKDMGGEGVIAKRLTGRYSRGRSSDWLKVKAIYSVTCVAVGYDPGNGSREALGALRLAVFEPGDGGYAVHSLGRVGSGFSPTTALEMRDLIDAATVPPLRISNLPVVEVECLGVTSNGVLRQPVYKGIRTDLEWTSALRSQLTSIPTR